MSLPARTVSGLSPAAKALYVAAHASPEDTLVAFWIPFVAAIAPFVTAGVGGVRMHHTNARALNAGAGALFRLADTIHARLDARDVAYHVPGWGSSNLQNNVEIFVGFSFGLQPEASDRGGATPAPK